MEKVKQENYCRVTGLRIGEKRKGNLKSFDRRTGKSHANAGKSRGREGRAEAPGNLKEERFYGREVG